MTREEAIEKLELLRQKVDEETYRALILAIKALEQNESAEKWYKLFVEKLDEQEPCEDAISRDEVMSLFKTYWRCFVNHENMELFKGVIQELPSVTPSRRKGHWIREVDFGNCVHYVCSECKNEGEKDYCPNCGAEMESEE